MSSQDSVQDEAPGQLNGEYYLVGESDARTRFVAGLRSLADYLADNPVVPVPRYGCSVLVVASGTDEEKFSQVETVGRMLGEQPADDGEASGHYEVRRSFGLVDYRFFGVSADRAARYRALASYADSVEPEEPAEPAHLAAEAFPAGGDGVASHPAQASDGHRVTGVLRPAPRGRVP